MPIQTGAERFDSAARESAYPEPPLTRGSFEYAQMPPQQAPEPPRKRGALSTALVLVFAAAIAFFSANVLLGNILALNGGSAQNETTRIVVHNGTVVGNAENEDVGSASGLSFLFPSAVEQPQAEEVVEVQDVPINVDYSSYVPGAQQLPAPYYRSLFDIKHQMAYDQILAGIREMRAEIPIETVPAADIATVFEAVLNDNPDIFWVGLEYAYVTAETPDQAVGVNVNYTMDAAAKDAFQQTIDAAVTEAVNTANTLPTTYDKVKFFYDTVCNISSYDTLGPNNQTLAGVFVDHQAACAGYARAFQYMCYRAGISCAYMMGTGDDGSGAVSHAWNAVEIDGVVSYVDVTWGDQASMNIPDYYAFLCITKDDMIRTGHVFARPEWAPEATDPRYEYWAMHNGYFDVYGYEAVLSRCASGIGNGERSTYLRFATPEMMDAAYDDFVCSPVSASDIVSLYPDKFDHATGSSPYSAYKVEGMNVLVLIWQTLDTAPPAEVEEPVAGGGTPTVVEPAITS